MTATSSGSTQGAGQRGPRVIDASVAIKWVVAENGTAEALELLKNKLFAPALFQAECANILWKKVRRGEMSGREAGIAARILEGSGIQFSGREPELGRVVELALEINHPAYDSVYLGLAELLGIPLITADERLIEAVDSARRSGKGLAGISVLPLIHRTTAH